MKTLDYVSIGMLIECRVSNRVQNTPLIGNHTPQAATWRKHNTRSLRRYR
ncbi:BQ5605_C005g03512 [Microbotryum silenes-dioicae]|uniref:BQ5605_C005g03512 protein n=1 Tax=Microbotryum silenes-dioicae TaxID=796604 RepID=A0A2X0MB40_9BASI|nr:BQ5605_C005g03512 [Microbotryum silenes-dioicae]